MKKLISLLILVLAITSCGLHHEGETIKDAIRPEIYTKVKLQTNIGKLSENQKRIIPILIEVAKIMDGIFWQQAYGDKDELLGSLSDDKTEGFVNVNYGPWDRLANNKPFLGGAGEKPLGANFYPTDMTKEEFEAADLEDKASLYTLLRRNEAGELYTIPYHEAFTEETKRASELLGQAAELVENAELKRYLLLKAEALLTDEYYESDMAWMDMTTNQIDIITGPTETYEDQLFGYKASHTTYVLVKDMEWSSRLAKYAALLPQLQTGLPVPEEYKAEEPGSDAQLAAFDVIYYAGDCNAGSKTIAVNLPNDEQVQLEKGTRMSHKKNAMKSKYDQFLVPIS